MQHFFVYSVMHISIEPLNRRGEGWKREIELLLRLYNICKDREETMEVIEDADEEHDALRSKSSSRTISKTGSVSHEEEDWLESLQELRGRFRIIEKGRRDTSAAANLNRSDGRGRKDKKDGRKNNNTTNNKDSKRNNAKNNRNRKTSGSSSSSTKPINEQRPKRKISNSINN
jgi:hypothetical protein